MKTLYRARQEFESSLSAYVQAAGRLHYAVSTVLTLIESGADANAAIQAANLKQCVEDFDKVRHGD